MKTNNNKIISLIHHDLKNHRGAATRTHQSRLEEGNSLELLDIVFELMKVPPSAEIDWGKTYCNYINFAPYYLIPSNSEGLRNQAELCFTHLQCIVDLEIEQKVKISSNNAQG